MRVLVYLLASMILAEKAQAFEALSYSGRLVRADGVPVSGPVDIKFDLFYTNNTTTPVCSKTITDVALSNGVFHAKLDFLPANCGTNSITTVLSNVPAGESVAIQVTDLDNSKTYSLQALNSVPSSIMANMAKTLAQMGAVDGQILQWNGTTMKWEPASAASSAPSGSAGGDLSGTYPNPVINALSALKIGGGLVDNTEFSYLNGVTSNIQTQINSLQGNIAAGTTTQYFRGDKTWQTLDTSVVPENGPWYFTFDRVTATPLTGYAVGTAVPLNGTDTVMGALGKLEAQITANDAAFDSSGIWTKAVNDIYYNAGNVGVGTSSPEYALDVSAASQTMRASAPDNNWAFVLQNSTPGSNDSPYIILRDNQATAKKIYMRKEGESLTVLGDDATYRFRVGTDASTASYFNGGYVGIGTFNPAALLDLTSTTSGLLIPRMTTTQRDNISAPPVGLQIYNTQTNKLNYFDGAWKELSAGSSGVTSITVGTGLTPTGNITATGSIAVDVGTTANKIVQLDGTGKLPAVDGSQLTNLSAAPSGSAGGDLTGTYPNPSIAAGAIVDADVSATAAIAQSKISGLTTALNGKEPTITAGTSAQYWSGDKTWVTLDTSVVPENGNLYFLDSRVRSAFMTGYAVGPAIPLVAGDTLIQALGKLEAQIIANDTAFDNSGVWSKNLTEIFYTAGNVGIGTADPSERLQVGDATSSNAAERLKIISKNDVVLELMADVDNVNEDENPYIFLSQDGLVSTQYVMGITGLSGTDPRGNASTDATSNSLYFGSATATSGSNIQFAPDGNVRMTINNAGQVGIGTNDPQSALEIRGTHNGTAATLLRLSTTGSNMSTSTGLGFYEGTGLNVANIRSVDDGSGEVSLRFDTYNSGLNSNSVLITGSGNLGVGMTPGASTKAAVKGNLFVSDGEVSIEQGTAGEAGRLNIQGQSNGNNYAMQFFVNDDWSKYWMLSHRSSPGETNNFLIEEWDGTSYGQHFTIKPGGNVGLGTVDPGERLEVSGNAKVSGQIVGSSQTITGGTNLISWNSNAISTDYNCASSFQFTDLQDGGTYTLVVTNTGTTQCNFSTTVSGKGAGTVSYRFKPANAARTTTSHTIYTLMRVGSVVYVSWASGF